MRDSDNGADSILGRGADLAALHEFLDRCTVDTAAMVLSGDAGVGKSVLLEAAATDARARGVRVLSASGTEFEADLAFAGLHQLMSPLLAEQARITAGTLRLALGMRDGPPPSRGQVTDAVLEVLDAIAGEQPVLGDVERSHVTQSALRPGDLASSRPPQVRHRRST